MSHFSEAAWVDFARGLLPHAEAGALESHLRSNCEECLQSVTLWQTVVKYLSQEAQYVPPEQTVQDVQATYAISKPWRWLIEIARRTELIFDSFRQPAPAFVRGSASPSRRLVHEAEPYLIDLRLENVRDRLYLIGQILNSEKPDQEMYGVDVLLLEGEELVARTKASSTGEFELQCDRYRALRLFINIRGHRAIGIVVPDEES
jgi:hypothetical protein